MHLNVSPKEYHNSSRFNKNQACTPVFFLLINFVDSKKKKVAIFGWKKKKSIRREKKKSSNIKLKTYRKTFTTKNNNKYTYKAYTSQCFSKTKNSKIANLLNLKGILTLISDTIYISGLIIQERNTAILQYLGLGAGVPINTHLVLLSRQGLMNQLTLMSLWYS
jgi:hypothetical protein